MITLAYSGGRQVVYSQTRRQRGRHDKWPTHAHSQPFSGFGATASHQFANVLTVQLIDGTVYAYIVRLWPTFAQAEAFENASGNFVTWDGKKGFVGEFFNYVARPGVIAKMVGTDLNAWLASH